MTERACSQSTASEGSVVFSADALTVRAASGVQLLAMKLSAMRDSVDDADAAAILARLSGAKEEVWRTLQPFLDPSMSEWKRQNFDALWRALHEHR
jgi:hypothetical protein